MLVELLDRLCFNLIDSYPKIREFRLCIVLALIERFAIVEFSLDLALFGFELVDIGLDGVGINWPYE